VSTILGIDFETTGLDLVEDRVTEVGMVLWDIPSKTPVQISGFLVKTPKPITEEITKLTGITREMLDAFGVEEPKALKAVEQFVRKTDYVMAHNGADFDKPLLENWLAREKVELPAKTWIDSKTDLPAAAYQKSAGLKYMAADHGFLYDGHRAVNDVLAMLKILSFYDVETVIERAKQPTIHVQAMVTFDTNKLAKERGYHWKPETKQWVKPIKANELEQEEKEAKFRIRVLSEVQKPEPEKKLA
jgi:DNA polymerase III subunit epsilon